MQRFLLTTAVTLLFGLFLAGCGASNTKATTINGNWTATLMNTGGTQAFAFTTSLVESGSGTVNVTNFSFSTNSPCFVSGETETGTFTLSGDFGGNVNGKFGLNVQSSSPAGNTLTLTGTAAGNTITGTWSLTGGSGCAGNGAFTMMRM